MKGFILSAVWFLFGVNLHAQDSLVSRIVLIGDGGQFTNGKHPVSDAIKKHIPLDKKTVLLFLGDNVYKVGLPDDQVITYNLAKSVLDSQLSIVTNTPARLYMIPGNHDWNNGKPAGYESIVREQYYVNLLGRENVRYYPENGCPGPVEIPIDSMTVLVVLDTQWWIHTYDKPGIESDCPYKTEDEVLTQLEDILNRNFRKLVILATHHPFRSNGVHGGYFGLKQHIFPFTELRKNLYIPLPVLGSIYPIARSVFGTPQDLKHPTYQNMIHDIEQVAREHPNLIFVHGHEHNLQLIRDTSYNYIVSGSGSKTSRVSRAGNTVYADAELGFATLEISKNKNVRASFYTVTDSMRQTFSENILNFSKLPELEASEEPMVHKEGATFKDTVNVAASERYANAGKIQRWIIGNNYREEWSELINMPVFHINKEKGGFKITGLGGGKQTKSLKLEDSRGGEWTLRTIDKDPDKAIPEVFRNSIGEDIVQDLVSTAHPYGALVVPELAKANGTVVAKPELFFVPDDPALGYYRPIFANRVCMLESRNPTPDGEDTKSTAKLLEKMVEESDHRPDQEAVLKARLLDMLIADWDRHFDQWKWGTNDTGKGRIYYPVPKDRDQALSYSDGLLIKYVSNNRLPFLKGLRHDIPKLKWLNWSARDFDRLFLNDLSAEDWTRIVNEFSNNITDSIIERAVNRLPDKIFSISGPTIIEKLKSRREVLKTKALDYYKFISSYVNIPGSNMAEYYKVSNDENGRLQVSVYERLNDRDTGFKIYQRSFDPKVTEEIRLYGLHGNDLFEIDDNVNSRIKIRIIGGKGNDTFDIRGNVRNYLYDMDTSANVILNNSRSRNKFDNHPDVNRYSWVENEYTVHRYPRITMGFNNDDGFFVGTGFWRKSYGFRKYPFGSENRLSFNYALQGSYRLRHSGEFINVLGNYDLLTNASYINTTLDNFFGLGNNTEFDKSKGIRFYRARYKTTEAAVLLRRKYFGKLSFLVGPHFLHYWNDPKDNAGKILGEPELIGLDSANVYSNKSYLGGKFAIDLNNLNNELFPTRGIHWYNELSFLSGVTKQSNAITKLTSDMVVYASLRSPARVVTVIRLGAGHIFNNNFEYFQALNLGANNFLRGFRKNRFSGSSLAYGSLEVRVKLFESKWYILPGSVGILAFNDIGRVWMKNDPSRRWHNSFGGGLYYVPFNMVLVSANVAFSKEATLFNFSIGTKINLTF